MADSPRCPRCGSTDTSTSVDYKIKKGLGYAAEFGIGFLAGRFLGDVGADLVEDVSIADGVDKEWQCNRCGHVWRGIVNASHSSQARLGTAKPQNTSKSQKTYTASNTQYKTYDKQDRAELLKILYKCDGRGSGWNDEYSFIQDVEHLHNELQKSSISISKSKVYSVNSYKKLADIILDSGWTCAKYIASRDPQNTTLLKIVNGLGEEIEVAASNDPKGLRNLPFRMKVEDCFHIEGRGDVVAGRIEKGYITIGEKVAFNNNPQNTAIVVGIEIFNQLQQYAEFEDNVGLLLRDNGKINKGDILTKLQESEQKNSSQDNVRTDTSSDNTNENEYLEELKECLADGEIGASERRLLNKVRMKLGISEERAAELEASLQQPQLTEEEQEYLEAYQEAMEDGIISDKKRRLLDKLMKIYNISDERAKEIEMSIERG